LDATRDGIENGQPCLVDRGDGIVAKLASHSSLSASFSARLAFIRRLHFEDWSKLASAFALTISASLVSSDNAR